MAALVLVRPALGGVPGPARDPAHRAGGTAAAQHPLAGRVRRAGRADPAEQRRSLVTGAGRHLPLRPLWLCRACAAPWPCATARLTLLREYADDRIALLIYLAGLLHEAIGHLYTLNPHDAPEPGQLFDRFLAWARVRHQRGWPDAVPHCDREL
ncbi:hypothetical protein [Micromonospora sp. RTGN7]|uniref:hypothetical protein n=1 Tax=Micromonospora sp. RTGN7 TaxID=3016526 RepID=UPI0029FECFA4|nr:hypothetical protein [Micromonospora sp. RTGN7]